MARDKRKLPIKRALEWAFGDEAAQLELPETSDIDDRGFGFGTEYVLLQRMRLGGVKIDVSKGKSRTNEDADMLAAVVGSLPDHLGGRWMAIRVATLARAQTAPDWMPGMAPKIVPLEWRRGSRFGRFAKTEVVRRGVRNVVTPHPKNPMRTIHRRVKYEEEWCPITWEVHPQEIEAARRDYGRWWRALDYIRDRVQSSDLLHSVAVTNAMPPRRPWASPAGETPPGTSA